MLIAYDYDIDDFCIVNVGDLKLMEYDMSCFLDLVYDYEYYALGIKKLKNFKKMG